MLGERRACRRLRLYKINLCPTSSCSARTLSRNCAPKTAGSLPQTLARGTNAWKPTLAAASLLAIPWSLAKQGQRRSAGLRDLRQNGEQRPELYRGQRPRCSEGAPVLIRKDALDNGVTERPIPPNPAKPAAFMQGSSTRRACSFAPPCCA